MGSVAPMKRTADAGTRLLVTLQEHVLVRAGEGGESDVGYIRRTLADAVDNPSSRESTLLALATYLSHTLTGIVPDL